MPRQIKGSWVDKYLYYVSSKSSDAPKVWHKWSALTCIAATLKRHVHVIMPLGGWKLYPTMYTLLVGRPGLGKGLAMGEAMSIVKEAAVTNTLSGKLTMPYVLDLLSKGFSTPAAASSGGIQVVTDQSAFMWSSELSVFMNAYKDTIEILTDLWDTKDDPYMTGSITRSGHIIKAPTLSLLGGSAPEWLAKSIPSDAIGGGFTRRINFIYANKKEIPIAMNGTRLDVIRSDLVSDLRQISIIKGQFKISPEALMMLDKYQKEAEPDEFDDAATSGYITSRPAHAMKLSMVFSASRGDDLTISKEDFTNAINAVDEAQAGMKVVFRAVGANNLVMVCDKIVRFLERRGSATRTEIARITWQDVNSQELDIALATLEGGGLISSRVQGRTLIYKAIPSPVKASGVVP